MPEEMEKEASPAGLEAFSASEAPAPPSPDNDPASIEISLFRQISELRSELAAKDLELRRASAELEAVRVVYADFYESSPVGYLTVDRNGVMLDANIRCSEMLGLKRDEICGKNILLIVADELREACRLFLRRVFESEGFQRTKLRLIKEGSPVFQAFLEGVSIKGGAGRLSQCRIAISDITERERIERLLHIQRDLSRELSTVFDMRKAADCMLDACLRIEDIDCGWFYGVESTGQALALISSKGPSAELCDDVSVFGLGSRLFQMVLRGLPTYLESEMLFRAHELDAFTKSSVKSLCVVPVHYEGSPVACLVLGSRRLSELPSVSRAAIESIATETGDVFIRIKMESALRESEQRLRGIMDNASSIIYVKDLEGRFLLINDQFPKVFKMPKERIYGKTNREIFLAADADALMEHDCQVVKSGKSMEFEESFRLPDGSVHTYLVTKFPLFDKAGKPCGVCGIDTDITQRKQAEERLRSSEERLRTVADFTYAWEYWISPSGELLYISPSVERITGHPASAFFADKGLLASIVVEEDRSSFLEGFRDCMQTVDVHKSEFKIVSKSGEQRWIGHVCQPVYGSDGSFLGRRGSNADITDRKNANAALRKAMEEAEAANRVKSQFIANLSHEIRTPMNAIIGFTDLVLSTQLNEHQRKCMSMVKGRGEDLLVIINDILDISRIEAGKMQVSLVRINIKEIARDIVRSFQHDASKKGVNVSAKVAESIPLELMGDPVRIRQILSNLLGNAVKFTERGSVLLTLCACGEEHAASKDAAAGQPAKRPSVTLLFTVSDTGIGIPKDKQAVIFEAFTQADSSTVRKYGGTGLGLAICKKLVNIMDGRIWVESEPGKGSCFFFTIKLELPPKASLLKGKEGEKGTQNLNIPEAGA